MDASPHSEPGLNHQARRPRRSGSTSFETHERFNTAGPAHRCAAARPSGSGSHVVLGLLLARVLGGLDGSAAGVAHGQSGPGVCTPGAPPLRAAIRSARRVCPIPCPRAPCPVACATARAFAAASALDTSRRGFSWRLLKHPWGLVRGQTQAHQPAKLEPMQVGRASRNE